MELRKAVIFTFMVYCVRRTQTKVTEGKEKAVGRVQASPSVSFQRSPPSGVMWPAPQ
jgi:hypothetical protein